MTDDNAVVFWHRIWQRCLRTIRQENGYTLKQCADWAGVSHSYISRIETGNLPVPKDDEKIKGIVAAVCDNPAQMQLLQQIHEFGFAQRLKGMYPLNYGAQVEKYGRKPVDAVSI